MPKKRQATPPGSVEACSHEAQTLSADERLLDDSGGSRGDELRSEVERDAPPSNTASPNSIGGFFKPLRWGVDSLYLSYRGELSRAAHEQLLHLKTLAQSNDPSEVAQAQLSLGGHIFEVKDKGKKNFPFILADNAYHLQVAHPGGRLPMVYGQVRAELLAHLGAEKAEQDLRALIEQLGMVEGGAQVSRIDLYVDFVSNVEMESWDRHAWVTRAARIDSHAIAGQFTGWSIGLGGIIGARLYDKLLEIAVSGKSWLLPLWEQAGWVPSEPVWRLEFEIKREVLTQKGLSELPQVLKHLNGLWSYATTDWLRLTLPNPEDKTRTRWPVHPLWGCLASIDWEGNGGPLTRRFSPARTPNNAKLFQLGMSVILSYMAREGISDLYQGQEAFVTDAYRHYEGLSLREGLPFDELISEKLALKCREFNTRMNNPDLKQERQAAETARQAEAYRKGSRG